MPNVENDYNFISEKIGSLKRENQFLRSKSDDYAFSCLCIKAHFFKNPSLVFSDEIINESIVDGVSDGGVDILLTDPNSETSDLIICQSKYYNNIQFEDVFNAVTKMVNFYKDMEIGNYHLVNQKVQSRFTTLFAEVGDESKIKFVFYTSAPQKNIQERRIQKLISESFPNSTRFELILFFGKDIVEEIKESESRRPYVDNGILTIDHPNNVLRNGDNAVIVNISANSLKALYAQHNTNLLSRNLRYYIRKKEIDDAINDTIRNKPDNFWYRNNGITIICDDFDISGNQLKLHNFSIVNGGQTTTLIHKSDAINKSSDLCLPCKVITNEGIDEDEKNAFSLEIAKATNSQKAIKAIDLKANAPEQVRFARAMKDAGVYYQTKRGEVIPKEYKEEYKNSDLADIGKLCLSGVFQLPATSRSKPSTLYNDQFYHLIFNSSQQKIARISRDLLYLDYYFRKAFLQRFDKEHMNNPILQFAHNSRTICISYVSLMSRYINENIDVVKFNTSIHLFAEDNFYDNKLYEIFKQFDQCNYIIYPDVFEFDKDKLDNSLYILYSSIIKEGYKAFNITKSMDSSINESNYLKTDKNYYRILSISWDDLLFAAVNKIDIFKKIV